MDAGNTEHLRIRFPIPSGKKLAGSEMRLLTFDLDDPADAGRLTLVGLADWVDRKVRERLDGAPGIVAIIELRPDAPTTVVARVIVPHLVDA